MTDIKHIIEPERMGLWVAVGFVVALLALVVSLVCVQRLYYATAINQLEILKLNQKIESLKNDKVATITAPTLEAKRAP